MKHGAFLQLYYHFVWGTKKHTPAITAEVEPELYQTLAATCATLDIQVLAINGVEDHIHLLLEIPETLAVADVVQQLKDASAPGKSGPKALAGLAWQDSYGAITVRGNEIERIAEYVRRQKEHHAADTVTRVLERQSGT